VELALHYVEVENNGTGVVVRVSSFSSADTSDNILKTDLLPGLSAKQPKTVAGCVLALKEIIR
jgi:cytoskeleton-associated protein 5